MDAGPMQRLGPHSKQLPPTKIEEAATTEPYSAAGPKAALHRVTSATLTLSGVILSRDRCAAFV